MIRQTTDSSINNPAVDCVEIVRGLNLFCCGITEIRLLKCKGNYGGPFTISGYFDKDHFELAADLVSKLDRDFRPAGCYFIFNDCHSGCHARAFNRFEQRPANTTGNNEITKRRWVFVDIDPARPSGVSSSNDEKSQAIEDREIVFQELKRFAEPIVCDSGNGWHLFMPVEADATAETAKQIENLLAGLNQITSLVDVTASNAARLTKLYGTTGRKGDSTPDRPHRQARIVYVPDYLTQGWSVQ